MTEGTGFTDLQHEAGACLGAAILMLGLCMCTGLASNAGSFIPPLIQGGLLMVSGLLLMMVANYHKESLERSYNDW